MNMIHGTPNDEREASLRREKTGDPCVDQLHTIEDKMLQKLREFDEFENKSSDR